MPLLRNACVLLLSTVVVLVLATQSATAAVRITEVDNECDLIASLRPPITSTADVHDRQPVDWSRGVAACEAQVEAHPGEIRFIYQLGRAQDHTKNYVEALRDYKTAADAGYAEALDDIGQLYYNGHGVVQNFLTSYEYFEKSAAAGSNRALVALAAMFANGSGINKDDAKSLQFAEKAAQAGNPFGLLIIGNHYFNGAGVARDYKMAGQYYQQAADLGNGTAMKFLANMYEAGYLGSPDATKAVDLRLRAERVDPGSSDPSPAQLAPLRQASTQKSQLFTAAPARRGYSTERYNPAWQAAPGDTRCCPNNMLVCPLGRHFCGH